MKSWERFADLHVKECCAQVLTPWTESALLWAQRRVEAPRWEGWGQARQAEQATHWRAATTNQRALPLETLFFLNAYLRDLFEAGDVQVCSKMVVTFYLTSNVLLIGLLPEFDSTLQ